MNYWYSCYLSSDLESCQPWLGFFPLCSRVKLIYHTTFTLRFLIENSAAIFDDWVGVRQQHSQISLGKKDLCSWAWRSPPGPLHKHLLKTEAKGHLRDNPQHGWSGGSLIVEAPPDRKLARSTHSHKSRRMPPPQTSSSPTFNELLCYLIIEIFFY